MKNCLITIQNLQKNDKTILKDDKLEKKKERKKLTYIPNPLVIQVNILQD